MSTEMISFLIEIIGYFLIYIACDIGRSGSSVIRFWSWKKLLQIVLVTIGVVLCSRFN